GLVRSREPQRPPESLADAGINGEYHGHVHGTAECDAVHGRRAQHCEIETGLTAALSQPVLLVVVEIRRKVARVAFPGGSGERAEMAAVGLRALQQRDVTQTIT